MSIPKMKPYVASGIKAMLIHQLMLEKYLIKD
jgi:hypothetical protein